MTLTRMLDRSQENDHPEGAQLRFQLTLTTTTPEQGGDRLLDQVHAAVEAQVDDRCLAPQSSDLCTTAVYFRLPADQPAGERHVSIRVVFDDDVTFTPEQISEVQRNLETTFRAAQSHGDLPGSAFSVTCQAD